MRIILLTLAFRSLTLPANAADTAVPRSEFDAFAARVTAHLPSRWHVAGRTFGPQQLATHWGARPIGLKLQIDGPEMHSPLIYNGPTLTPAQEKEYLRPRPESIHVWIVPRTYKPKKDIFIADWFRPDEQQTHRLASTKTLDLYAYGGYSSTWPRWRTDLKNDFRRSPPK